MEKMERDPKKIAHEMIHIIETTQTEKEINRLVEARKKVSDAKNLREEKVNQISENDAKLKNLPANVGEMEAHYKMRKGIEDENVALKNFISDIDIRFLPELEEDLRLANEKVFDVLYPGVIQIKKKFQTELDVLFRDANAIINSFESALGVVRTDPRFAAIFHLDDLRNLREFNTAAAPRSLFDQITGMNSEIYKKR